MWPDPGGSHLHALSFILIFPSLSIFYFLRAKRAWQHYSANASAIAGLIAASFPRQPRFRLLSTLNDLTCLTLLIFFFLPFVYVD